jgi:hypothetical protein
MKFQAFYRVDGWAAPAVVMVSPLFAASNVTRAASRRALDAQR